MTQPFTFPDPEQLRNLPLIDYEGKPAPLPEEFVSAIAELKPLHDLLPEHERAETGRAILREHLLPSEPLFIQHQHWIRTKIPGRIALMRWNFMQQRLWKTIQDLRDQGRPIRIIILKARQEGCSTFIQSWQYEQCDREPNRVALTISYDDESTTELFAKTSMIHNSVWFPRPTKRSKGTLIEFQQPHGSVFHTRTAGNLRAGRGDTYHHVHLSEVPMWPNAAQVLDSVLQAVPEEPDTSIIIESTAMGATGDFYEIWQGAAAGENGFVPFFAPWFWDPRYTFRFKSEEQKRQFRDAMTPKEREIQRRHGLSLEQMAWRHHKIRDGLRGSVRRFQQEFPATPEEAFITSGFPAFNPELVEELRSNATPPATVAEIQLVKDATA